MNTITIQKGGVSFAIAILDKNTKPLLIGLAVGVLVFAILSN